jgi:hypothetical protein
MVESGMKIGPGGGESARDAGGAADLPASAT